MADTSYPRVEINPAHCHIYKRYYDTKGRLHVQDGPYVERRKIRHDKEQTFILLQGQKVLVYPSGTQNPSPLAVHWETRNEGEQS